MHETLRSTFKLERATKEEKIGWQQITSDLMYGTFYSIYAKFEYEKDKFKPISCTIKIQNFQGAISVGIKKINPVIEVIFDKTRGVEKYVYLLDITVCPLNNCCQKTQENLTLEFPKVKHPDAGNEVYEVNRTIASKGVFSPDILMAVRLQYDDVHRNDELDTNCFDVNSLAFIDTANYERDGDTIRMRGNYSVKPIDLTEDEIDSGNTEENFTGKDKNNHSKYPGLYRTGGFNYLRLRPCRNVYVKFV